MSLFPIYCGSDTMSSVAPKISKAISEAGKINSLPYGDDDYTKKCKEKIRKVLKTVSLKSWTTNEQQRKINQTR